MPGRSRPAVRHQSGFVPAAIHLRRLRCKPERSVRFATSTSSIAARSPPPTSQPPSLVKGLSFVRVEEFTALQIRLFGAYKPNPGFVGSDSFQVDIEFERQGQRY